MNVLRLARHAALLNALDRCPKGVAAVRRQELEKSFDMRGWDIRDLLTLLMLGIWRAVAAGIGALTTTWGRARTRKASPPSVWLSIRRNPFTCQAFSEDINMPGSL